MTSKIQAQVEAVQARVTSRMLALMEKGGNEWLKPWAASGLPANALTGKTYQGGNVLILALAAMYDYDGCNQWAGPGQWIKAGHKIIKGSKTTEILAPKIVKYKDDSGDEQIRLTGWIVRRVLNAKCIEGYEPRGNEEPRHLDTRDEQADSFINNVGVQIKVGGDRACYNMVQDLISLPRFEDFTSAAAYYGTAFHELAHATGHSSRLNRKLGNFFGSKEYAFEELIAELSAAFTCATLGVYKPGTEEHQDGQHAAYLKSWKRVLTDEPDAIMKAAAAASKATEWLMKKQPA